MVDVPPSLTGIGEAIAAKHGSLAHCVFLSGSLLEGIGNANSDVDVFVVRDEQGTRQASGAGTDYLIDDALVNIDYAWGTRVDTEFWRLSDVRQAAQTIGGSAGLDEVALGAIPEHRLQLAHRIRVGAPVAGFEAFEELRAAFDWTLLARILGRRFLVAYSDWAEDAAGAAKAGDAGTAMLTSRLALGAAVDMALAAAGSTNNKHKWRFAKLRQIGDAELAAAYLAAELEPDGSDASLLRTAKSRLRLAADVVQNASGRLRQMEGVR